MREQARRRCCQGSRRVHVGQGPRPAQVRRTHAPTRPWRSGRHPVLETRPPGPQPHRRRGRHVGTIQEAARRGGDAVTNLHQFLRRRAPHEHRVRHGQEVRGRPVRQRQTRPARASAERLACHPSAGRLLGRPQQPYRGGRSDSVPSTATRYGVRSQWSQAQ
ncbi:MAG: hypothetical protein UT86_C0001G0249 [Candidatus Magasanikbacteria bacterium GW2011_GWC2_40_17]|uniref:Uncharacterized protein n=1 Tax=Candidatus Magasanikbacteria bacterium GW2011_GWA2_42_32 TaxID=1619039 RepID=A0A0G1A9H7_9BACT|nr:MAG: hypothetical protein UT86_C0001G0249 [Candidatus Magasanikbacteria bacterium GW2011_GWC2_40_17]KKS57609.1 MAG: hypothetical protein UV20_C0001G0249 [Candidatus Magasanikbacteria bacterium GW2011_GWA2_42_32]